MKWRWADDGVPRRRKAKRARGPRCATRRLKFWLTSRGLRWNVPWFGELGPCWGRCERGQRFCVRCRRVHDELRRLGRAPARER